MQVFQNKEIVEIAGRVELVIGKLALNDIPGRFFLYYIAGSDRGLPHKKQVGDDTRPTALLEKSCSLLRFDAQAGGRKQKFGAEKMSDKGALGEEYQ